MFIVLVWNESVDRDQCTISCDIYNIWNVWLFDVEGEFFHRQIHDYNTNTMVSFVSFSFDPFLFTKNWKSKISYFTI